MATTVTYKGATLTTVDNETKTLTTGGTWMEGDLTLTDVTQGGGGGGIGELVASGTTTEAYGTSYAFEQSIPVFANAMAQSTYQPPAYLWVIKLTNNTHTGTSRKLTNIISLPTSNTMQQIYTYSTDGKMTYNYNYNTGTANITTRIGNVGSGSTYEVYRYTL